ncbi:MAG TPA: hypothetical protein VHY84_16995 [Bryobacteraceae bacterium]|jgi:hypothetical protein|nr:hypothetical protein [Bryobacteraceae bacterium]
MTDTESLKETATVGATEALKDVNNWLSQYARTNAELMQTAVNSAAPILTAWTNWYRSLLPAQLKVATAGSGASSRSSCAGDQSCCEIPETNCPPRCACTVHFDAGPGERRVASIRIRNTSKDDVTYTLSARPFENDGKTLAVSPLVLPASIKAAAGQTVQAAITVEVNDQFQNGSTWHSEVLVSGKYERCVKVELHVRADESCKFDLGDIPYRTKADEWYRHFQCSEPCFEPVTAPQQPPDPVTANPVGVIAEPRTQAGG